MINRWVGIGNMTADPVVRVTTTGKSVANFCLAVKRPSKDDVTDFINCVAWEKTGELVSKYCMKGTRIAVEGTLTSRNYEDRQGNKRTSYEIVVGSVTFLDTRQKEVQPKPEEPVYEDADDLTTDDLPF